MHDLGLWCLQGRVSFDRLAAFLCLEEVDPKAVDSSPSRRCECRVQQEGCGREEGAGRAAPDRCPLAGCQGPSQGASGSRMAPADHTIGRATWEQAPCCCFLPVIWWLLTGTYCVPLVTLYSGDRSNRPGPCPWAEGPGRWAWPCVLRLENNIGELQAPLYMVRLTKLELAGPPSVPSVPNPTPVGLVTLTELQWGEDDPSRG